MSASAFALAFALFIPACTGGDPPDVRTRGDGGDTRRPPDGDGGMTGGSSWSLSIDTSESDRYLPLDIETAAVRGRVSSSLGTDRVEIGPSDAPMSATVGAGGEFAATVPVEPGLSLNEVRAFDRGGNMARGNRSVLRASYLPEGELNDGAIAIAVNDAILSGLAAGALDMIGGLDLARFVPVGSVLVDDGMCRLFVDRVSHSPPAIHLSATPDGRLQLTATVSDISVGFHGSCNFLGTAATVREGSEIDETTAQLTMILSANPPPPGECVSGFSASDVAVAITEFDIDLRLEGCGILCWFGELVGEIAEGGIRDMMQERFAGEVMGLLDGFLADLSVLDIGTTLTFLDVPVDVDLCLTGLGPEGGVLVARIGAMARGPGGHGMAPGAPMLPATLPPAAPGKLFLHPGLLGQVLFSVWNGGALTIPDATSRFGMGGDAGIPLNVGALVLLVPQLRELIDSGRIAGDAPLQIDVDAGLAPFVVTSAPGPDAPPGVDLFIEMGNFEIKIRTGATELFVLATHVRLGVSLGATPEGALGPTLVPEGTTSTTWLIRSAVDGLPSRTADTLATLVDGLIVEQLSPLLSGATFDLPDFGVPIVIGDVVPTEGGYLEITLGTPPPAM